MDEYQFKGTGLTKKELYWGRDRFEEYQSNYPHLHKMSDLSTLEELIFQEALQERLKEKILSLTNNKKIDESSAIPSSLQQQLADNLDIQFKLKEKIGLFEDKKRLDAFKDFRETEEKFRQYRRENPDLFKVTCVKCAFPFYLKRRTVDYEPLTGSWFKDKILFNLPLFKKYLSGVPLEKKDMADILGVSQDYIDWIIEKFLTEKKDVETTDEPSSEVAPQSHQEGHSTEQQKPTE